jgi:tetratricopeptide (TPR) repeat protein
MPTIEQLEKLLAIDPTDTFVLYGLAQEHAKAAEFSRAIDFYDRCLAADPHYCYAYFHKARAHEAAGDTQAAIAALQAGLAASHEAGDGKAQSEITEYLAALEP